MYTVYILLSVRLGKYYVGHTSNITTRLFLHNRGRIRSTKSGTPWLIVYTECYTSKHEAYRRELQIKAYKEGEAFRKLIEKSNIKSWAGSEVAKRTRL